MDTDFPEYTIRLLLEQAYNAVHGIAAADQRKVSVLSAIQLSLMNAAREGTYPFPVENRREKIAILFLAFCKSSDPVTNSLILAFSLLINP